MARSVILETPEWVEQRAAKIDDPFERLRFLRRQMAALPDFNSPVRRERARSWRAASMIAAVVLAALVPAPTGTAETFTPSPIPTAGKVSPSASARVWLVNRSGPLELYSNGLRIDTSYVVSNRPRGRVQIFSLKGDPQETTSAPVGIVYHTTESNIVPFEQDENIRLQRFGRNLIDWVRDQRSYHYLIDRFGRVYRIVQESDAANHAGTSIWADGRGIYINLNDSFIGVSFEAQTDALDEVTPAQVASGKVLTEMLRSRYRISDEDCVTHAQVSVNPQNMRIGEHTDWAGKFPYAAMGLPDNYAIPVVSMCVFGFDYDSAFLKRTGTRWRGLDLAELRVARQAGAEGLETRTYRERLQRRYKKIAEALKAKSQEGS